MKNNSVMTTTALQKRVIKNIGFVEDKAVLEQINQLIEQTSNVYILSDYHVKRLEKSRKQIENGNFLTQEEMDNKVEEWLNEK